MNIKANVEVGNIVVKNLNSRKWCKTCNFVVEICNTTLRIVAFNIFYIVDVDLSVCYGYSPNSVYGTNFKK